MTAPEHRSVTPMSDKTVCPKCGKAVARGSTFCINCGSRIPTDQIPLTEDHAPDTAEEADVTLPDVDETLPLEGHPGLPEDVLPDLEEWHGLSADASETGTGTPAVGTGETAPLPSAEGQTHGAPDEDLSALSWDEGTIREVPSDMVREGDPFVEVEPPRVLEEDTVAVAPTGDLEWEESAVTAEALGDTVAVEAAMSHLFPEESRPSPDFIERIVGRARKIEIRDRTAVTRAPVCPSCGADLTEDGFTYPPYVFEAMGRARVEEGERRLENDDYERAIEEFEKARLLYEKAGDERLVQEAARLVDRAYEEVAASYFEQGERHLREHEFEWAIVQFKKAREHYMLTSDAKKRAKCAEKVRECYEEWGKVLEAEGDQLAKSGRTRAALERYRQAAEKYRLAEADKRRRGLEKKIRKI